MFFSFSQVVMDESQFSPLFWDGSSEVEQRYANLFSLAQ
jgi:hypothetical protein